MNNEFKKSSNGMTTRYILESDGGTTSASSVGSGSIPMPMGGVQRRQGDNLIAQEANKKLEPSKPRNFVAKNATTGGAGAHKDKKKAEKQGDVKYKKPFMEGVGEDHEIQMASSELQSIAKNAGALLDMVRKYSEQEGLEAWQQSKITKAADYLNSVLQSISGEQQGVAEGERTMSRAAKGYEKYGKKGMMALAKAGREGAGEKTLDKIRDKHDKYDESVDEAAKKGLYYYVNKRKKAGTSRDASSPKAPTAQAWKDAAKTAKKEGVAEGKEDKIAQLKKDHETAVHWSKNETSPQKREAARQKALKIKNHLEKQYKQGVAEGWSKKYKSSINCSHPKGFSQKAHCAGKNKHTESMMTMEATCPDCGMCQTHGNLNEIKKGAKDSNGFTKCWPGKHAEGTKKGKNGGQVRNCVPNEGADSYTESLAAKLAEKIPKNAPVKTYIDDFSKAAKTPNAKGHHQFKNKSPEKVRQMAIAASYGAKNPSKKK